MIFVPLYHSLITSAVIVFLSWQSRGRNPVIDAKKLFRKKSKFAMQYGEKYQK